ncbi:3'5'-cyclic nucleotide phosphodiesterase family protein [Tritrichomonas foetus]|uniref:3'5'-cyclic nucleotide phosphodiesterase family protein n=1 Tax=Tritrichomonas foetus TaxID=1144522 RepID=A0A1J4JAF1_9EUKA|nr:3'5'-cyclic nucleotide phosphodiesterase family protein [Tritrichomonas foetus]|eukprot:OHS96158.1 3'5'-cyclic nucleotide phosphodiesterase family protein [Tritrichomonas foetus]
MSHESNNEELSYTNSLLTILCQQRPSLSSVLELFTAKFAKCDHFALFLSPEIVELPFVICSDIINFQITDASSIQNIKANPVIKFIPFDSPTTFNGIENVSGLALGSITDKLTLLLINPQTTEFSEDFIDIFNMTKSALSIIYKQEEVDIPYSLKCVQAFSDAKMSSLSNRSFSVNNYHPAEIFLNTFALFVRSGISTRAGIDSSRLLRFLVILRRHYNDVPYHNWFHALDVTQFVYSVICKANLRKYLPDIEIFGLLFSAICHDTDHNGMNNTFHRNAKTTLAHLAPNLPPLEHHHSCISMDLSNDLFMTLDADVKLELSHFIVNCIMATDMEKHKIFLTEFQEIQNGFISEKAEHRQLLAQIILKAADLSNTVRDFDEAIRMTKKLSNECYRQGDREVELGLPISPMCDRKDTTPMCCGQIGFYKFVAGPLMNELHQFFPELSDNARQFADNLATWERMKSELEQK